MDWIGRFHPVIVHLPIGMLILAALLQLFWGKRAEWQKFIKTTLMIGFFAAIIACICGWVLANEGGYHDRSLFIHRWAGIGVAIVAFLMWRWHTKKETARYRTLAHLAMVGGLAYTGHLGGNMTHGIGYTVEDAPGLLQKMAGYDGRPTHTAYSDPDSVRIYHDLVKPFVDKKCTTCHNQYLTKGGLDVSSDSLFREGGRNGDVLGPAAESEFYRRVTMDDYSRKFMPPKGDPLSYQEIKLLGWWLDNGSDFDKTVAEAEHPKEIQAILMDRYGLDTKPKTFLEKTKVDPVSQEIMDRLTALGFGVNQLAQDNYFLDVRWRDVDTLNVNDAIPALEEVAPNVAWLDLSKAGVQDGSLSSIGKLKNMVRLKLDNNEITDQNIADLNGLQHLESLNLYNTQVTDAAISELKKLSGLKRLYLWLSQVTVAGKEEMEAAIPEIDVNLGITEG
ncbi:MAG: hypothetical protein KTR24_09260 [Saprospiraceae bacterium]|nr:hypothetical protein [Saprospiraceae bacterium]